MHRRKAEGCWLLQVAELRETQPDCRLYIAITKCDQLEEAPSVAEQDTAEQADSSASSNGTDQNLISITESSMKPKAGSPVALPFQCPCHFCNCHPGCGGSMSLTVLVCLAVDHMHRQQSAASIASSSCRREVSDEDIAAYAKQLSGPRFGPPRIFATSAKLGVS